MLVYDIESDGLLDTVEVIHCVNIKDRKTGKGYAFNVGVYTDGTPAQRDGTVEDGLRMLMAADCIGGANINWYDNPAIRKLYPWFKPRGIIRDSKVESCVIWTNLKDIDFARQKSKKYPQGWPVRLAGRQSLEAWGWRLGQHKGEFKPTNYTNPATGEPHTWKTIGFTRDMDLYGRQDVDVTAAWFDLIDSKKYSQECLDIEQAVNVLLFQQHERGFAFDIEAAEKLVAVLQRRMAVLQTLLQEAFKPWWAPKIAKGSAVFSPKRDNRKEGYVAGAPFTKVQLTVFNPGSRHHIANRLQARYGWRPSEFTNDGSPKIDETTMAPLPWPEARLLMEYLLVEKRLGQAATGKKAWLAYAKRGGIYGRDSHSVPRIHGVVNTNGAVTGRMTHADPNVAQVPKVGSPYGEECRSCFIATPGLVLVGCDAEGIEARALAHYMAPYDGGDYARAVSEGKKEDETDVHNVNKRGAGLNKRDNAKTWFYAFCYGAGDYKLGTIVYDDFTPESRARFDAKFPASAKDRRAAAIKSLGTKSRAAILKNIPALGTVTDMVKANAKKRGYLIGLDGRHLHVRSDHSALNTLLQSAGAVLMKKALILFDAREAATVRSIGGTVGYVANVHDECQFETEEQHAENLGRGFAHCIELAGKHFKFRCPLSGSYGIGRSWRDTH